MFLVFFKETSYFTSPEFDLCQHRYKLTIYPSKTGTNLIISQLRTDYLENKYQLFSICLEIENKKYTQCCRDKYRLCHTDYDILFIGKKYIIPHADANFIFNHFFENSYMLTNFKLSIKIIIVSNNISTLKLENSFNNSLTKNTKYSLEHLYNDNQFCDITIHILDNTIKFHRSVLAQASLVFYTMFIFRMQEAISIVQIDDINYNAMVEVKKYIYTNTFSSEGTLELMLYDLFDIALKYQIENLIFECYKFISNNIKSFDINQCQNLMSFIEHKNLSYSDNKYSNIQHLIFIC